MTENKALITGGAGFIGRFLGEHLLANGWQVVIADKLGPERASALRTELAGQEKATVIDCDLSSPDWQALPQDGITHVFHMAAILGVQNVIDRPYQTLDLNTRLLQNAIAYSSGLPGLEWFVFASTSEVYGAAVEKLDAEVPTGETQTLALPDLTEPRSSYMLSKLFGEALTIHSGLPYTIVRPHNVYGPRMGMRHVIPQLLQKAATLPDGTPLEVYSVDHTRTFCFIDDAVALLTAMATSDACMNQVLNLGTQNPEVRIGRLAEIVLETVGKAPAITPLPPTPGSPERRCPDMRKTHALLGYDPERVTLEEGVARTYAWYSKNVFSVDGRAA